MPSHHIRLRVRNRQSRPFPLSHAPCRINGTRGVTDFVFIVFYADVLAAAFPAWQPVQKGLAGALTGDGVWRMLSFTISELLFLIILAAIQQIGSFIYKRFFYRSSASLNL